MAFTEIPTEQGAILDALGSSGIGQAAGRLLKKNIPHTALPCEEIVTRIL